MPHYNWRNRPNSNESIITSRKDSRNSGSVTTDSGCNSGSEKRSPSPLEDNPDYSHLQIPHVSNVPIENSDRILCYGCNLPFEECTISRQPRLMPCLHSFCTQCLQNVNDKLENLQVTRANSKPSHRDLNFISYKKFENWQSSQRLQKIMLCLSAHRKNKISGVFRTWDLLHYKI